MSAQHVLPTPTGEVPTPAIAQCFLPLQKVQALQDEIVEEQAAQEEGEERKRHRLHACEAPDLSHVFIPPDGWSPTNSVTLNLTGLKHM